MAGILESLDGQIEQLFSSWNSWSSLLVIALISTVTYSFVTAREPDTHPLLLSRQASVSQVRQPGESAVYRSVDTAHGLALRSGLNVKGAGASKWAAGKDGDLRDIWRAVVLGSGNRDDQTQHRLQTILGRERTLQHTAKDLNRQLNAIGSYVDKKKYKRVATYLPNTVELLLTVFAAAFYGFEVVLVPYEYKEDALAQLLSDSGASFIIANAGSLPLASINARCKEVKEVVWVVENTTRHMDFEDDDDDLDTLSWHDLVAQQSQTDSDEVPENKSEPAFAVPNIITTSSEPKTLGEMTTFTQKNLVAAVAAQIHALPMKGRMGPEDVFLPTDTLTKHYILVQTLAALFSGATVALNSVAGENVALPLACIGVEPTIIAAAAPSLLKLYNETAPTVNNSMKKLVLRSQTQALKAGYMPSATILSAISSPTRTALGNAPHKLRLIYAFERSNRGDKSLSPDMISELRAFTGARVIHSLTTPVVAGAIAQTLFYDYRDGEQLRGRQAHFGPPTSSVEIKLVDTDSHKTVRDHDAEGEIVVSGPAVVNGQSRIGSIGTMRQDGTLALL